MVLIGRYLPVRAMLDDLGRSVPDITEVGEVKT
jgi:hypothetical protein